ncbi:MAG: glycoside hydrolase family 78 protein [Cyclobacteriaceae bacterium]
MKMKGNKLILSLAVALLSISSAVAKVSVGQLTTEYLVDPIGIDVSKPRLSWKLNTSDYNVMQSAYEIKVARKSADLASQGDLIWTTGKVASDQSVNVVYEGERLNSGERAYWQVRVWDQKGKVSSWSQPAFWEVGLLNTSDWKANWITMEEEKSATSLPSQFYRNDFKAEKPIKSARVYVSSLGLYQLYINGQKVGKDLFTPGFTSYKKRIQYQTYDVTDMLQSENVIGAIVGDGWYRGYLGWDGGRSYYGDQLGLIAQLILEYEDGSSQVVVTNEQWKTSYGPIDESDIYNGEKYDARKAMDGWAQAGFDDRGWQPVSSLDHPKDILVASNGLPVRAIEEITPIKKIITPKREIVFDLGQNIVGWARLKVSGKAGDEVIMQFAEVLDKDGNFFTKNLRAAEATDIYTLNGDGEEVFEPHFTFHGFRFIKIEGYPGTPDIGDVTGVVIHSDMKPTGNFVCSDPLINQLQSNIQWGQRDNFLDIPTDCPQRDERVGWTGDAQVFSTTAAFNFDVAAFYTKWLKDLALDQQPNGEVPNVIPDMWNNKLGGTTAWGDAAVIVPWTVYRAYGDKRILEEQYASMKGWVDYMKNKSGEDYLWNQKNKHHWGDWLAFHSDSPAYAGSVTVNDLIATAYFKYSASLLSKAANILGKNDEAQVYEELAEKVKKAFIQEFITPNGRLVSHTQTAYALALSFDLIPEELRAKAAQHFADDVKKFKHLTTGFVGTPLLCTTLSSIGRDDLAFMLLNRKEFPGWLYPVTQGATTIWERWDTQKPDGTIIDGMNSFNHYAYGAIGEWLYTHVAGLKIDEDNPGYKRSILSPHPGGGLTSAKAEIESIYGTVISDWKLENGTMNYQVTVPPNTTALVTLPKADAADVMVSNQSGKVIKSLELMQKGKSASATVGSGTYIFKYTFSNK